TPPSVSCGSDDGIWHGANVGIACTADDGGSGLANPADASFALSTSVAAGSESANAATNSRQICDNAGNCATAGPVGGNMVDRKPPTVTVPGNLTVNATAPVGAVVSYAASATDGTDPTPKLVCSPPSGSTFAIGQTAVSCTATDHGGNMAA